MSGLFKNTAGQSVLLFAFNRTTNVPVTGDAANITATVSIDEAAPGGTTTANPTETSGGYYLLPLTQAETNGDTLDFVPASGTSDVQVIVWQTSRYTQPQYMPDLKLTAAGAVSQVDVNADMRGTDGANTVVPDNGQGAAVIAHGQTGPWSSADVTNLAAKDDITNQTATLTGAAQLNKQADHVLKRNMSTARGSSDGDGSGRMPIDGFARLRNRVVVGSTGNTTIYEEDGTTVAFVQTTTRDPDAEPIVEFTS